MRQAATAWASWSSSACEIAMSSTAWKPAGVPSASGRTRWASAIIAS